MSYNKSFRKSGFTLLEVLISLAILLAGIIAILNFFPFALKANRDAELLSQAALLAQLKAEEIRRDLKTNVDLLNQIKSLTTPTESVRFSQNPNLSYCFCGISLLDPNDDPQNPADDHGVARIIVRLDKSYDPGEKIIYELRFDE
jgi:prepilin-type N-terminal cleavage/methylation domain-containing protein